MCWCDKPFNPNKIYDKPINAPNFTPITSESKYLTKAGIIYLTIKIGLRGTIKLREQAAILFIYRSQCLNF